MPSPNDQIQSRKKPPPSDPQKDLQLELELEAFAELLLDIYEYRYLKKRGSAGPSSSFDDGLGERKMK